MPGLRDPRVHLVAGQLTALAWLCALRHLDLDVVGVDEVFARDAEATGCSLLDRRTTEVTVVVRRETLGVFPALAGVRFRTEAVHGDREGLVRLCGDRAIAHRAGAEALQDVLGRFDLIDGDRRSLSELEFEQPAEGAEALGLIVDETRVLLEDVVSTFAGGVLQLEHRVRVEEVVLALSSPLVLASDLEGAVSPFGWVLREGVGLAFLDRLGQDVEPDTTEPADRAREVLVDDFGRETDRLEDLCAGVGGNGRNAHLGHDLQDAEPGCLDVVGVRLGRIEIAEAEFAVGDHLVDGRKGEVRVDRIGAVTEQGADVVHFPDIARLDHEPNLGAGLVPHEVMVQGAAGEEGRNRAVDEAAASIGDDEHRCAVGDRRVSIDAKSLDCGRKSVPATAGIEACAEHGGAEAIRTLVAIERDDATEFGVGDDRIVEMDGSTGGRHGIEQIAFRADPSEQRGDDLLANCVERRVGDLGEQLLEVVRHVA